MAAVGDARKRSVEELMEKIRALPPSDFCGHFSSDYEGNCMTCAREAERRADMARAWDEGAKEAWQYRGGYGSPLVNPYRAEAAE